MISHLGSIRGLLFATLLFAIIGLLIIPPSSQSHDTYFILSPLHRIAVGACLGMMLWSSILLLSKKTRSRWVHLFVAISTLAVVINLWSMYELFWIKVVQEQFAQPEGWTVYPPLSEIDEELTRLEHNAEKNMQILKGFWWILVGYSAYNLYRFIKLSITSKDSVAASK